MMKNKNNTRNFESQEYEHLLEAFLQEEEGARQPGVSVVSYKGALYEVPAHERNGLTASFSGLRLNWGRQSFTPEKGEAARFFVGMEKEDTALFSLCLDEIACTDDEGLCPVAFYLYREGEPRPLAEGIDSLMTGYDSRTDFTEAEGALSPGRYFLLADGLADEGERAVLQPLGNYLYLPFVVMEAGDALAHPVVEAAEATRPAIELQAGLCTSGTLALSVGFRDDLPVGQELAALCFTQDWRVAGQDERLLSARKRGERRLTFRFRSDYIWMPGRYTVVLKHNRTPFAVVVFDYKGEPHSPAAWRTLAATDMEAVLTRGLVAGDMWRRTKDFVGMARLRPQLVELARTSGYNACCQELQLPELRENVYAAVSSDILFHAKRLAYCLPKLLGYCTTERKSVDCAEWVEHDSPDELLDGRTGCAFSLYNITALCSDKGHACLKALEEAVDNTFFFWTLALCGTEAELERLFACSPLLAAAVRPEYRFRLERPSVAETVHLFQQEIKETAYRLDAAAEDELARQVAAHHEAVCLWAKDDRTRFVLRGMLGRVKRRVRRQYVPGGKLTRNEWTVVRAEDIGLDEWLERYQADVCADKAGAVSGRAFEESMRELDAMVGLASLKEALNTTFCRMCFDERRRRLGLSVKDASVHHMVFTGNPGTGKTTVARLMGKVYRALGLLSDGEVIVTERRELVGEYLGQTEEKMNVVLQKARGKVLFIDEAYSLCTDSDDRRDFGRHVIEGLLTVLAQPHPDMLVVLAGYPEEMERMLQSNPGLSSRFPYHFHFDDYNADELMQIARHVLEQEDYRLAPEAEVLLREAVTDALTHKDRYFANARWIKTFIASGVLPAMACRVMLSGETDNKDLYCMVEDADIRQALLTQKVPVGKQRPRIGFKA